MRRTLSLGAVSFALIAVACGSGGGVEVDDDAEIQEDSGVLADVTVDTSQPAKDSSTPQDGTITPINDATLDINYGDAIWIADGQSGNDAAQETGTGCAPDEILCNGNTAEICKNGQLSTQVCTNGNVCADGYGCVVCDPGSGSCNGNIATLCNSLGTGTTTTTCDGQLGLSCQAGVCIGDCSNIGESYIGCEYYAVTMLNDQLPQGTFPFAISVANTTSKSATVNITGPQTVTGSPFTIAANSIQSIVLPWESSISDTTGTLEQTKGAYHVKSTEPVTVYQFNARDYQIGNSFSYTNDASLLIPVNALTGNYYVVTHPDWNASSDGYASQHLPGLITIVATADNTSVKFTTNTNNAVVANVNLGIAASGLSTFTMNQGDVVQINSAANATATAYGTDPSGSTIVASQPVEVFGGADCTNIPAQVQACDHVEEIVFPLETLTKSYLVVPPNMTGITTGKKPSHFVRIVGTAANTTLTYNPNTITGAPTTLTAGQTGLFETSTPFQVTASSPILIGMYMESSNNYGGGTLNGDPAMSVAVGTSQFRDNYVFTAPNNYYVNWLTLIAPSNTSVTVDGTSIPASSFTAIGTSGYGFYYDQLCSGNCINGTGNHSASSTLGFGVQVYGYGSYTSYWYPGGLNLTR